MGKRQDLHNVLVSFLGSKRVYFQAPAKLDYPCVIYELDDYDVDYGNDKVYRFMKRYTVTLIGRNPETDDFVQKMFTLPYCSFDRRFINDNLYHDVFTLYF